MLQDPEFCAALGLNEANSGDTDKAIEMLQTAADAKVARPAVYLTFAQLHIKKIRAAKGDAYRLQANEFSEIETLIKAAVAQSPKAPQVYLQILDLLGCSQEPEKELLGKVSADCLRLFPDNMDLLSRIIPLLMQGNLRQNARDLLEAADKCAFSDKDSAQLEQLWFSIGGRTPK